MHFKTVNLVGGGKLNIEIDTAVSEAVRKEINRLTVQAQEFGIEHLLSEPVTGLAKAYEDGITMLSFLRPDIEHDVLRGQIGFNWHRLQACLALADRDELMPWEDSLPEPTIDLIELMADAGIRGRKAGEKLRDAMFTPAEAPCAETIRRSLACESIALKIRCCRIDLTIDEILTKIGFYEPALLRNMELAKAGLPL